MIRVITDGQDPLTKPILDYLRARYGMSPNDVTDLKLHSPHGDVQTITITVHVDPEVIIGS